MRPASGIYPTPNSYTILIPVTHRTNLGISFTRRPASAPG
jgi:hypothetical protein